MCVSKTQHNATHPHISTVLYDDEDAAAACVQQHRKRMHAGTPTCPVPPTTKQGGQQQFQTTCSSRLFVQLQENVVWFYENSPVRENERNELTGKQLFLENRQRIYLPACLPVEEYANFSARHVPSRKAREKKCGDLRESKEISPGVSFYLPEDKWYLMCV
ncbi:unnamed protein product [Hymenolepis diminuta]|uniref:Uncharacterized protein n=1 Tax=Hymenolepis diminuta TaxID=6216 RepID=A0A0R3SM49_HYMDI|nr:unnamed protein product [Hymenolepis diminuta]